MCLLTWVQADPLGGARLLDIKQVASLAEKALEGGLLHQRRRRRQQRNT